jgi:hypothetical protein
MPAPFLKDEREVQRSIRRADLPLKIPALVPLAAASLLALLLKIGVDVARIMYDMNNVQMAARPVFIRVAQKDDIVAERCAANIVAEFGARAAQHTGQPGQALAVIGYR